MQTILDHLMWYKHTYTQIHTNKHANIHTYIPHWSSDMSWSIQQSASSRVHQTGYEMNRTRQRHEDVSVSVYGCGDSERVRSWSLQLEQPSILQSSPCFLNSLPSVPQSRKRGRKDLNSKPMNITTDESSGVYYLFGIFFCFEAQFSA